MGAWGYLLFQSDTDCDIIHEFDRACGVADLAASTGKGVHPQSQVWAISLVTIDKGLYITSSERTQAVMDRTLGLSIYAGHCSSAADLPLVCNHLNSGGLAKCLQFCNNGEGERQHTQSLRGYKSNAYYYVILGACAMTVGATLSPSFLDGLRSTYKLVGLSRGAIAQLKKALFSGNDDSGGYVNGVPYNFHGSIGLRETMENPRPNHIPNPMGMLGFNIPDGLSAPPPKPFGRRLCGNCGDSSRDDGSALLKCGKCKTQCYCSQSCQSAHWTAHKRACKVARKAEPAKEDSRKDVAMPDV